MGGIPTHDDEHSLTFARIAIRHGVVWFLSGGKYSVWGFPRPSQTKNSMLIKFQAEKTEKRTLTKVRTEGAGGTQRVPYSGNNPCRDKNRYKLPNVLLWQLVRK